MLPQQNPGDKRYKIRKNVAAAAAVIAAVDNDRRGAYTPDEIRIGISEKNEAEKKEDDSCD
ncbi:MAG: hypothetical protein ABJQ90_00005 [Parasphingorhabdus sp.]